MAALTSSMPTLIDWAKRRDPDGKIAKIVELLSQQNELLIDMVWREGNEATGDQVTPRVTLPTVSWRTLNQGGGISKSTTGQIKFSTGILEAWAEVDCDLADLESDQAAFRASEASAFLEAMNQEATRVMIYGNQAANPEQITGLATYYNAISGATNASHIVDGGGTQGDNSSIWLVVWGDQTVYGIFPRGSQAGLVHEDKGKTTIQISGLGGTRLDVYQDKFQWKPGIVVKDWRYAVRGANVDISNLTTNTTPADLYAMMIKMWHRIPNMRAGRPAFYVNRTLFEYLDIQGRTAVSNGGQLSYEVVDGVAQYAFRGIPVRKVDQLLENEARVI